MANTLRITLNLTTSIRTVYRNGRVVSVNRQSPAARVAQRLAAVAQLRRSAHWGDVGNARAILQQLRDQRH